MKVLSKTPVNYVLSVELDRVEAEIILFLVSKGVLNGPYGDAMARIQNELRGHVADGPCLNLRARNGVCGANITYISLEKV